MKDYIPTFKDDRDRLITVTMLITSMFFVFIPSLIVIFLPKDYIGESTYNISKSLFNFELLLFLISLLFMIPIIGWIAGFFMIPIMLLINIIVIIINLSGIANNSKLIIPEPYKFM